MKGYSNIVTVKHRLGIVFGLLAAVIILATNVVPGSDQYYQAVRKSVEKKDKQHKDRSAGDSAEYLTITQDLISPVSPLVITQDWHFLGEILHEEDDHVEFMPRHIDSYNSLFRTLFRQIISPNAP